MISLASFSNIPYKGGGLKFKRTIRKKILRSIHFNRTNIAASNKRWCKGALVLGFDSRL